MGDLKVGNGEKSQEMDLEEGGKETDDVYHSTNVHSFDLKQMTLSFQVRGDIGITRRGIWRRVCALSL